MDIHGQQIEIVGVMRPEFSGLDDAPLDVWLPITMLPALTTSDPFRAPQPRELTIFARLRRDVTEEHANEALTPFMVGVATAEAAGGRPVTSSAVRAALTSRATPNPITFELLAILSPIFAAFGLVLVAACANVSSVMLARALAASARSYPAVGRRQPRARRPAAADGSGDHRPARRRGRARHRRPGAARRPRGVLRHAAADDGAIDASGAARTRPARVWVRARGCRDCRRALRAAAGMQATRLRLTSALRGEVAPRLKSGVLRNLLVVGQVTVSLILLVAAVTLARNGVTVAATDLGFDVSGVFSINEQGQGSARIPKAARVLETEAGAANVAVTSSNPLFGALGSIGAAALDSTDTKTTAYMFVSPEYFPLLGIPIHRGRTFSAPEAQGEAAVGIVSEPPRGCSGRAPSQWPRAAARAARRQPGRRVEGVFRRHHHRRCQGRRHGHAVPGHRSRNRLPAHLTRRRARGRAAGAANGGERREQEHLSRLLERVDVNRATFEVVTLAEIREVLLYHSASRRGSDRFWGSSRSP